MRLKPALQTAAVVVSFLALGLGCIDTTDMTHRYMEEETPAGTVPPATGVQDSSPAAPPNLQNRRARKSEETLASTIQEFTAVYSERDRPRIVIFLNRHLSDDVQEWHTSSRIVVEGQMRLDLAGVQATRDGAVLGSIQSGESQVVAGAARVKGEDGKLYEQTRLPDDRPDPPENWMWQFEDSFAAPFLDAKTVLLDRASILRLTASDEAGTDSNQNALDPKQLEMVALLGKADLFMEVLVHRNLLSPVGYEFKVSVKEVATGRLLVSVSSLAWKQERLKYLSGGRVVAGPRGYEISDDPFPKLDRVSTGLAEDVMQGLMKVWRDG